MPRLAPASRTIRCYLPLTLPQLAGHWPRLGAATAFTPAHADALRGDALEEAEFTAFSVAAAAAIADAAAARCARVVLSLDLPAGAHGTEVYPRVLAVPAEAATASGVVSAHVDEPETVAALAAADSDAAAESVLENADLLWYDASEIPVLVAGARNATD